MFATEIWCQKWCQKSTEPNLGKITPTPGKDDSADPGPASAAQQNEAGIPTHASQSNLPVLSLLDTRGNIAENSKRWRQVWDSCPIASRLTQQENQIRVAKFITCIGSDALEVYNSLPLEREDDKTVMS